MGGIGRPRYNAQMLREIPQVAQSDKKSVKRWFSDPDFDLIVWQARSGDIRRFEFCFGKGEAEQALAWKAGSGFEQFQIDDGEDRPMRHKMAPIMHKPAAINYKRVEQDFCRVAKIIDSQVVAFVKTRLQEGG